MLGITNFEYNSLGVNLSAAMLSNGKQESELIFFSKVFADLFSRESLLYWVELSRTVADLIKEINRN